MIPNLTSGRPSWESLGGDAQVAAERDLQRAADARVVDLADDRLGHRFAEVGALQEDLAEGAQRARLPAEAASSPRSTPAENTGPSPRSTTQCTASSAAASRSACASARSSSWFIALRFSGRFSTTWRTAPRSSVMTMLMVAPSVCFRMAGHWRAVCMGGFDKIKAVRNARAEL